MNSLKKALTRQDPRKYQKSKIEISVFKKTNQWDEVEWIMQKKNQKKTSDNSIQDHFKMIVEANFVNGELKDIGKLFKELKEKYKQFHCDSSISSQNAGGIFMVLKKSLQLQEGVLLRKYLCTAIQKLQAYLKQKKNKEKQKCLNDFNKFMNIFKPAKQQKEQKQESLFKLPLSTSATNLRIRVTKQEHNFQEDEIALKRKKSLDFKNKSKATSQKQQGASKLQMFLKESNMKLVKAKIEYDYSAIFQASKSNIQSRNKTTYVEPKNEKQVITKATHGKKNQGFVFYRPTPKRS